MMSDLQMRPTEQLRQNLAARLRELTGPLLDSESLTGPLLDSESFDLAEEMMVLCGIDPGRECESGMENCGPVVMSDSEGVPLCLRCYVHLVLQQVSK